MSKPSFIVRSFITLTTLICVFIGVFVPGQETTAAVGINRQINYQAKLLTPLSVPVADGTYSMRFVIFDALAPGGNRLWTAAGTTNAPSAISVTVTNGLFTVQLGDVSAGQNPLNLDWNTDSLFLSVQIEADSEMTPRKRLTAVPYAFMAESLQGQYASSSIASTGGNLFALHQLSTDAASADRSSLAIYTSGTSNQYDYLIKANSGSDVFTVSREGNVTTTGNFATNGNTIFGNAISDTVVFNARVNSSFIPATNNAYDLGSVTQAWANIYASGTAFLQSAILTNATATNVTTTNLSAGLVSSTRFIANYGTAAAPAFTFSNKNDGIFYTGLAVGIGVGGNQVFKVDNGDMTITGHFYTSLNNSVDIGRAKFSWRDFYASGTAYIGTDVVVGGSSVCLENGINCPAGATADINWTFEPSSDFVRNATATTDIVLGSSVTSTGAPAYFDLSGAQNGTSTFYFGHATNANIVLGGTSTTVGFMNSLFKVDGDDLFVAGNIGSASSVYTNGAFVAGSGSTYFGDGFINKTNGSLTVTSSANVLINPSGYVGIGTSTPTEKLTIVGGVKNTLTSNQALTYLSTWSPDVTIFSIDVVGKYAYIGDVGGKFYIVDVSSPANATTVSSIILPSSQVAYDISVQGRYAYIGASSGVFGSLTIVDISDPSTPTILSTTVAGTGLVNVVVQGDYAYGSLTGGDVAIYHIANPRAPTLVYSAASGAVTVRDVRVSGRYFYYVTAQAVAGNNFFVMDVATATAPVLVGQHVVEGAGTGNNDLRSLAVQGQYAYVHSATTGTFAIIDISDAAAPVTVSTMTISESGAFPVNSKVLDVSGRYAFVGTDDNRVVTIDISSSTQPHVVATGFSPDQAVYYGRVRGGYLYSAYAKLHIFQIPGVDTASLIADAGELGSLSVLGGADIVGSLRVANGLSVGIGGIMTNGTFAANGVGTSTFVNGISVQGQAVCLADGTNCQVTSNVATLADVTALGSSATTTLQLYGGFLSASSTVTSTFTVAGDTSLQGVTMTNATASSVTTTNLSALLVSSTRFIAHQGVLSSLAFSFSGDENTGFYSQASDAMSWVAGGVNVLNLDTSSITVGANFYPSSNNTRSLGLATNSWSNIFASGTAYIGTDVKVNGVSVCLQDGTNCASGGSTLAQVTALGSSATTTLQFYGGFLSASSTVTSTFTVLGDTTLQNVTSTFGYSTNFTAQNYTVSTTNPTVLRSVRNATRISTPTGIPAISGRFAYVPSLNLVAIVDIGDPSSATTVSVTSATAVQSVAVGGKYLYLTGSTSAGLRIWDISQPSKPVQIEGGIGSAQGDMGLAVVGNYVYVAAQTGGVFKVYDVSSSTAGFVAGTFTSSTGYSTAVGVAVQGSYAYMTSAGQLSVIDITNPARPTSSGVVRDTTNLASSKYLAVRGAYAYVPSADRFNVIDIVSATAPRIVATVTDTSKLTGASQVSLAGNYAYVSASTDDSVVIFDIADPTNPRMVGYLTDSTNLDAATGLIVSGKEAYITAGTGAATNAFTILSLSGIQAPSANIGSLSVGSLFTGDSVDIGGHLNVRGGATINSGGLMVNGGLSVQGSATSSIEGLLNVNSGIRVSRGAVDVIPSSPLRNVTVSTTAGASHGDMAIRDNYLFVADSFLHRIWVYDATQPSTFRALSSLTDSTKLASAQGAQIVGKYLYTLAPGNNTGNDRLTIIDTSDPINLSVVTSVQIANAPNKIAIQGMFAYIAHQSAAGPSITIYDISSSTNPVLIRSISDSAKFDNGTNAIAISGNRLYTHGSSKFTVTDITNPYTATATAVNASNGAGQINGLVARGRYVFSSAAGDIIAMDVSSTTAVPMRTVCATNNVDAITSAGKYLYGMDTTFQVIDISNPPSGCTQVASVAGPTGMSAPDAIVIRGNQIFITESNTIAMGTLNGADIPTANIGSLYGGAASFADDVTVIGSIFTQGGIHADRDILTNGAITVRGTGTSTFAGPTTFGNNVLIGGTSTTVDFMNSQFAMDGNDLFVAGNIGSASSVYTNGAFVAGTGSTWFGNGFINKTDGQLSIRASASTTFTSGISDATGRVAFTFNNENTLAYPSRLLEFRNNGAMAFYCDAAGSCVYGVSSLVAFDATNGRLTVGSQKVSLTQLAGESSYFAANSGATVALKIKGVSTQSADLQQWTTSTGETVARLAYDGSFYTSGTLFVGGNISAGSIAPTTNNTYDLGTSINAWKDIYASGTAHLAGVISGSVTTTNIHNPYTLSQTIPLITTYTLSAPGLALGLDVSGRYAYVIDNAGWLSVVDVSDPRSVTTVGMVLPHAGFTPSSVFVQGRYAYMLAKDGATGWFTIIDVSNPSTPTVISNTEISNSVSSVRIQGHYAYVGTAAWIRIFDIADPYSPRLDAQINLLGSGPLRDLEVSGRYVYYSAGTTAGGNNFFIADITTSTAPVEVGQLAVEGAGTGNNNITGLSYQGRYVYAFSQTSSTLSIIDVSNPSSPATKSTFSIGTTPGGGNGLMDVSGRYAYITSASGTILTIDITSSTNPVFAATLSSYSVAGKVVGNYFYGTYISLFISELPGVDTATLQADSAEVGRLSTRGDASFGGQVDIENGLTVGLGGIFAQGAISAGLGTSTFLGNVIVGSSTYGGGLNSLYVHGGDDLFVAGNIGSASSVYTNGAFVAGSGSTYFGDGFINKTDGVLNIQSGGTTMLSIDATAVTSSGALYATQIFSSGTATSTFAGAVSSTRFLAQDGTAALPALGIANTNGSGGLNGFYNYAGNNIGVAINGVGPYVVFSGGSLGTQFNVITPLANNSYNNGLPTLSWKDMYVSGTFYGVSQTLTGTSTVGPFSFTSDAGAVTAMDYPCTSASPSEQSCSYDFDVNGTPFFSVYSRSDGAGGIQSTSTAVRFYQPLWASPNNAIDIGAVGTNAFRNIYASGTLFSDGVTTTHIDVIDLTSSTRTIGAGNFLHSWNVGVNNVFGVVGAAVSSTFNVADPFQYYMNGPNGTFTFDNTGEVSAVVNSAGGYFMNNVSSTAGTGAYQEVHASILVADFTSTTNGGALFGRKCGDSITCRIAQFGTDADGARVSIRGNGSVYSDAAAVTTGGDYAEYFSTTDTTLTVGEVVAMTGETATSVKRAMAGDRSWTLGVISGAPAMIGNAGANQVNANDPNFKPVGLLGQIPVNVSDSNGVIRAGDNLMAGNNGRAVRATGVGMILGQAMETLTGMEGTIMVYVNPSWSAEGVFESTNNKTNIAPLGLADATTTAYDSFGLAFTGSVWSVASSTSIESTFTLQNDVITASSSLFTLRNGLDASLLTISNVGDVSVTGDLTVGRRLFLGSKTTGAGSTSTYLFVDDTQAPTSTYIATNADGWSTATTYDYAERFHSNDALESGDLVAADASGKDLVRRVTSKDDVVLGIVSTKPGFITGAYATGTFPIALAGRVPTRVSTAGGAIVPGDHLAPSDVPGVAVKAVGSGPIVGIALEAYDAPVEGKISVFVQPGWKGGEVVQTGSSPASVTYQTVSSPVASPRAGLAKIVAGATEVSVTFPSLNAYPLITVSPYGQTTQGWWLTNVTDHGFTIVLGEAPMFDLTLAWKAEASPAGAMMSLSDGTSAPYDPTSGLIISDPAPIAQDVTSTVPIVETTSTTPVETMTTTTTTDTTSVTTTMTP